jgi:transposase-like protein
LPTRPWAFVASWGVKYNQALEYLTKDRDALLAFSDFRSEHWKYPPTIANWPGLGTGIMPE